MKISEYNQMMRYLTSTGEFVKNRRNNDEQSKIKNVGKNNKKTEKKSVEKQNIKVAMSETPEEEADMQMQMEAEQFYKWYLKNRGKTYKDYLKDKRAMLTPEQKKDPKIIELPLPFTFEEELDRMLEEEEKKPVDDESFQKGYEQGIQSILRVRKV